MLKKEIEVRQRLKNTGLLGNDGTLLSDFHIYSTLRRKIPRMGVFRIKNKNIISRSLFVLGGEDIFLFDTEYGLILEGQVKIEQGNQLVKTIAKMKPKKISINVRGDNDSIGFYKQLADYVSQNSIDIHITGLCANACANYLLPAAKKIIIEPYGVIAFQNSYAGEFEDMKIASENEFKNIKIAFENSYLYNNMDFTEFLYSFLTSKKNQLLIYFLSKNEAELFQKVNAYLTSRDAVDFLDLSQEDFYVFMDQLTEEEINKIKQFFIHNVYNNQRTLLLNQQLKILTEIVNLEDQVLDFYPLPSQYHYTYYEFIKRINKLTTDNRFYEIFPYQLKKSYPLPEKFKLEYVIPSVQVLKKLGLNIISGENHFQSLGKEITNSSTGSLYLTEEVLKKCKDFDSSDLNFLNQCLER